jgi:hypothetical protein
MKLWIMNIEEVVSIEKLVNMERWINIEVILLEEDLTDQLHRSSIAIENILSDRRMLKCKYELLIICV